MYSPTGWGDAQMRTEIDDLANQVPEHKRAEFVEAAWAATVLCWDDIPQKVRESICRRTAMLAGLKYAMASHS